MTEQERAEIEWYAAESQFMLQVAQAHQQRLVEIQAIMKWETRGAPPDVKEKVE